MHATWTDIPYSTTVYYSVGDTALGWSEEFSFTSVPKADPERPTSLAAFGDMGNVQHDGSGQHSWDFNDRGEIPSYNTSALVAADDAAEIVLHIGDISYAVGFLAEWDNFFHQIQPAASAKPWMTAIGNHEQGYTKSFYPGLDSGAGQHTAFQEQNTVDMQRWKLPEGWAEHTNPEGRIYCRCSTPNF